MNNENWILTLINKNSSSVDDYREEHEDKIKSRRNWANSVKILAESMEVWEELPSHFKNYIENMQKTGKIEKENNDLKLEVI